MPSSRGLQRSESRYGTARIDNRKRLPLFDGLVEPVHDTIELTRIDVVLIHAHRHAVSVWRVAQIPQHFLRPRTISRSHEQAGVVAHEARMPRRSLYALSAALALQRTCLSPRTRCRTRSSRRMRRRRPHALPLGIGESTIIVSCPFEHESQNASEQRVQGIILKRPVEQVDHVTVPVREGTY